MRFLTWLFGKKGVTRTGVAERETTSSPTDKQIPARDPRGPKSVPSEAENLRRWRESGQARAWVKEHQGQWNHAEWLALLDELRRSSFWPMQPDQVGWVLEALKREWQQRN